MAELPANNQPANAPEGQANPQAPSNAPATPAPGAGEDIAARLQRMEADQQKLLAHKQALEADLKKYRDRDKERDEATKAEKAALEAKLREQGDFAKLLEIEREKARALEAQYAALAPKAEAYSAFEARAKDEIAKAKEAGGLPDYLVSLIDSVDPVRAVEALQKFRAASATAPKQPAPPAPAPGAAPPPSNVPGTVRTIADLQNLKTSDPARFEQIVRGAQPTLAQRVGARLTGVGRK